MGRRFFTTRNKRAELYSIAPDKKTDIICEIVYFSEWCIVLKAARRVKRCFCRGYKPLKHDIELTQRTVHNEISGDLDIFNIYTILSSQLCRTNNMPYLISFYFFFSPEFYLYHTQKRCDYQYSRYNYRAKRFPQQIEL